MDQKTKLAMVYSHWVAADAVRITNRMRIPGEKKFRRRYGTSAVEVGNMLSSFYRMLIFYALVYVVIEAYRTLDDRSDELDQLIDSGPTNDLFQLRNAVFHVQNEPLNKKLWGFLQKPDSEKWIYRVHQGMWRYFKQRYPIENFLDDARKDYEGRVSQRRWDFGKKALGVLVVLAAIASAFYLLS